MASTKKDEVKVNTNQFDESTDRYLEQQRQQVKDTTSNLSQTTEKFTESVTKFQDDNRRNVEKNADTFRKYQGQISTATQEVIQRGSINTIEIQKNICNTVHSTCVQFLDNISKSSENFKTPEEWYEIYNPFNFQEYFLNIPNTQKFINESTVSGVENLNKMIEFTQRYCNDVVRNNVDYVRRLRSNNRQ
jgi:hypothetical protein